MVPFLITISFQSWLCCPNVEDVEAFQKYWHNLTSRTDWNLQIGCSFWLACVEGTLPNNIGVVLKSNRHLSKFIQKLFRRGKFSHLLIFVGRSAVLQKTYPLLLHWVVNITLHIVYYNPPTTSVLQKIQGCVQGFIFTWGDPNARALRSNP